MTKLFEKELASLINRHSVENAVDMPDFILAGMICRMIEAMGPGIKKALDWHGCDSVCHPNLAWRAGHHGTACPKDGDDFSHPFHGLCVGVRNGHLQIKDVEDNVYEVEVWQFELDS